MKLLLDSDFLMGLFSVTDPHHQSSLNTLGNIADKYELLVSNLVIYETATVLSYKVNQQISIEFVNKFSSLGINTIEFNKELELSTWKFFKQQTKKGTSFIDCSNLTIIEKYKLDGILSFDTFYPASLRVQ